MDMAVLAAWGPWLLAAAATITALLVIVRFVRMILAGARRVGHFFDDWFGEPGREGHPARPGVMARLSSVEGHIGRMCDRLGSVESRAEAIEHEMHPNSGASLRDAVDDIRAQTRHPAAPTVHQTFVSPDMHDSGSDQS